MNFRCVTNDLMHKQAKFLIHSYYDIMMLCDTQCEKSNSLNFCSFCYKYFKVRSQRFFRLMTFQRILSVSTERQTRLDLLNSKSGEVGL